jgi:phage FluMu protein gp41
LFETQDQILAESILLESLSRFDDMHTATTTKTLGILHRMFLARQLLQQAQQVTKLAETNNLHISQSAGSKQGVYNLNKRVAFVLDYSGSMSGSKIRTAVENINSIVGDRINELDSVMIVHFTEVVHVDFTLSLKKGNEEQLKTIISG